LNRRRFELIRYIESRPDTFVTLTSGERMIVREPMDEVMQRAVRYQQTKFLLPPQPNARTLQKESA
jgi:flagellar protein FlbD